MFGRSDSKLKAKLDVFGPNPVHAVEYLGVHVDLGAIQAIQGFRGGRHSAMFSMQMAGSTRFMSYGIDRPTLAEASAKEWQSMQDRVRSDYDELLAAWHEYKRYHARG